MRNTCHLIESVALCKMTIDSFGKRPVKMIRVSITRLVSVLRGPHVGILVFRKRRQVLWLRIEIDVEIAGQYMCIVGKFFSLHHFQASLDTGFFLDAAQKQMRIKNKPLIDRMAIAL